MARELTPLHLELESLEEHETVDMVLSILAPPAADFAQWMYDETRGQPFYLLETLKDFLERRVLHPKRGRDGRWSFVLDAEHDLGRAVRVPSTVQAVIRSRLNRLSPNAFSLLAGGAVLEKGLTFDCLRTIANVSEDLALAALDELISSRILMDAPHPGAAGAYTFANDTLRDVVYTESGDARRRLFHRRALEILEASRAPEAVLAHHAFAAGLAQAAFRHSLSAGREALRISALGEATVHFERARQIVEDAPEISDEGDIGELFVQLRRTYEMGGQKEKALALEAGRDGGEG
jgi:predicted ATPase